MTNKIYKKAHKVYRTALFNPKKNKWVMNPKKIKKLEKEIERFVIQGFNDIDDEMLSDITYTLTVGILEQVLTELESI